MAVYSFQRQQSECFFAVIKLLLMVILLSLFLAIFLIQVKSALLVVCSLLIKTETVFPWTLRSSRPSARATAAIREMNKLAESFSFCWVLRTTTAAHSIRIKLAILAIPTDLLATQQLPQRFSGDVHKNEMGLWKAVKKKEREREKKIPYIKSGCSSRAMAAKSWLNGGWVRPPVVSD